MKQLKQKPRETSWTFFTILNISSSEHRETLDNHGFLPPPSNDAGDEDSTEVFAEEKEMEEIEEQADSPSQTNQTNQS